jgi:hypothetical protein
MATDVDASDLLPVFWRNRFQRSELMPFRVDLEHIDWTMPLDCGFQDLINVHDLASHRIGGPQLQGRVDPGRLYPQAGHAAEVADRLAARRESALEGPQIPNQAVIGRGGRLMAVHVGFGIPGQPK